MVLDNLRHKKEKKKNKKSKWKIMHNIISDYYKNWKFVSWFAKMTKLIRNFPRTKNFRVMISIELIVLDYCATVFIENNLIRNDESRWNHSDLKFHNLKTQFLFRNTKYFLSTCKNLVFRGLTQLLLPALLYQHTK